MRPAFNLVAARAALGLALAAPVPALAQTAPAAAPPDTEACSPMMARWQSAEARYSAMDPADLAAYNTVQNAIDRAAHFCEAGQGAEAKAIMDASKNPLPRLQ